jgi:hypothetical protein
LDIIQCHKHQVHEDGPSKINQIFSWGEIRGTSAWLSVTAAPPSMIRMVGKPIFRVELESRIHKSALDTKDVANLLQAHAGIIEYASFQVV